MSLMTDEEFASARKRPDDQYFERGLAAAASKFVEATWAEPLLLARRIWGAAAENGFETVARFVGSVAGKVARPVFSLFHAKGAHALEDTLKATRLAENLTGIYGDDFYINDKRVVRRVHTCPFRHREGATILCHVGEAAGQELFSGLVPGIRHSVHVTMARGNSHCEYSYEID
jgi:hypothetical protein